MAILNPPQKGGGHYRGDFVAIVLWANLFLSMLGLGVMDENAWLMGFSLVVSYVMCDLLLHYVIIEEKDGHYRTAWRKISLDRRIRLLVVMFWFLLFGSAIAEILAYTVLLPLAVIPGLTQFGLVLFGTIIMASFVWLEVVKFYPKHNTTPPTSQQSPPT